MARKRRPFFHRRNLDGQETGRAVRRKIPYRKGIFILPSLLTLTSLFLAFYSLISAIRNEFVLSAALILAAGFFDGIDGKVARWTNTTTRFGLELDSLSDVIAFGVAPALLSFQWVLTGYERYGWVSAFLFVACGALRLARFNVQSGSIDPRRFNGLPIPAAAAMVATTVMFFYKLELSPYDYRFAILLLVIMLAIFMVSSIKFHAFKDLTFVKEKPFPATVAFVLSLACVAVQPLVVPFLICAAYVISGPILTLYLMRMRKLTRQKSVESKLTDEPDVSTTSPQTPDSQIFAKPNDNGRPDASTAPPQIPDVQYGSKSDTEESTEIKPDSQPDVSMTSPEISDSSNGPKHKAKS
jgi:CDP-diacylglycerol---serine O-phosphatidyltransferase